MAGIKYWLWLRTRHGLSNQICTRLLEQFGDPEKIYFAAPEDYLQTEGVTKAQLSALADKKLDRAEAVLEDCERLGVRILSCTDAAYPSRLRAIPDAPCVLYYKGIWPDFDSEAAVALIGTRKATPYGIRIGERLGYELSKGGAYVVSGLAAGGDAAGHRGALLAGARTAAVLGGGIDVVYPAENRALFEDIAVNGVLISEYPPGTEPRGPHFLERNRIISGLSVGGDCGGSGAAQRYHEYGAACCRTRKRRLCCARPGGCAFQPRLQPSAAGGRRRRYSGLGCIARMAKPFSGQNQDGCIRCAAFGWTHGAASGNGSECSGRAETPGNSS